MTNGADDDRIRSPLLALDRPCSSPVARDPPGVRAQGNIGSAIELATYGIGIRRNTVESTLVSGVYVHRITTAPSPLLHVLSAPLHASAHHGALPHRYVRLIDETTGAIRVERGEQMVFPEATETVLPEECMLVASLIAR